MRKVYRAMADWLKITEIPMNSHNSMIIAR